MQQRLNRFLDVMSEFLAHRKGLLPTIAIAFILINAVLQFIPGAGFLSTSNILLHVGIIVAILGFMLAWAL